MGNENNQLDSGIWQLLVSFIPAEKEQKHFVHVLFGSN